MTKTYEEKEKELREELEKKYGEPILTTQEVNNILWWDQVPLIKKKYARKPLTGIVVLMTEGWDGPNFSMRWVVNKGIVIFEENYSDNELLDKLELISSNKLDSEKIWKKENYHENGNLKRRYHLKGDHYLRSIKFGINEEYDIHGNLIREDPIVLYHLLIQKEDGLYYQENSNKPFTGLCDDYWNGRIVQGKKIGDWVSEDAECGEVYKEGKLIKRYDWYGNADFYKDGKLIKSYYRYENKTEYYYNE